MFATRVRPRSKNRSAAFSLVELVIVVVIIGVIASIAVPRLSIAANGAAGAALQATVANVRKAIDVYYAEHGSYPGYTPGTTTPNGTKFVEQLTMYSDATGTTNVTPSATFQFGPYLQEPFPTNPTNDLSNVLVKANPSVPNPSAGTAGWVAVLSHGYFQVAATDTDLQNLGIVNIQIRDTIRMK